MWQLPSTDTSGMIDVMPTLLVLWMRYIVGEGLRIMSVDDNAANTRSVSMNAPLMVVVREWKWLSAAAAGAAVGLAKPGMCSSIQTNPCRTCGIECVECIESCIRMR